MQTGPTEYNVNLGSRRANVVADFLQKSGEKKIQTVSYGESRAVGKTPEEMANERRVTLLPAASPLWRALVLSKKGEKTDLRKRKYLFDASWSMEPYRRDIIYFPYPEGSEVFLFCRANLAINGQYARRIDGADKYSLCDGTPLWNSVMEMMEKNMKRGEILTVVTDGEETDVAPEALQPFVDKIVRLAQEREIRIDMINVNLGTAIGGAYFFTKHLIRTAKETGGMHYLVNLADYRP